jgi:transcriptional regulator with XRE-family HTH domain
MVSLAVGSPDQVTGTRRRGNVQAEPNPEKTSEQLRLEQVAAARRLWADEVRQALAERGLSVHACARKVGISPGALQAWLSTEVEPSPRAMERLAHVLGRSHFRLVALLGWLPSELGDVSARLEATEKLKDALAEASRWVESATEVVGLSGGSVLGNAVLKASDGWEVLLRQSVRGVNHPTRFVTAVAFSRVGEPASAKPAPDRTAADRSEIEGLLGELVELVGAGWSPRERAARWNVKRPDLVMEVPVLLASKPRGLRPNREVPANIVVVGIPMTGAPEVASLIATALDWSYTDLQTATRLSFGISANPDDEPAAETEVASRLVREARAGAKLTVWAWNSVQPILNTFSEIGPDRPLVIFLEAPDALVEFAEHHRGHAGALRAQDMIRGTLLRREADTYKTLRLPDLPLPEPGEAHDVDLFFDAYVRCAFAAVQWLCERHGVPPLDSAPGVLGDLWRAREERDPALVTPA